METKILIIGVGGAGCNAVDIMDIPNSKKLFIDEDAHNLRKLKADGVRIEMDHNPFWPSKHNSPEISKDKALFHIDEIKECIKEAFEEK